jgi:hypothetical protein
MEEHDHRQITHRQDAGDDLDRQLDTALAKYAQIEPRAGLENRVLATLHAERSRVPQRAWWRWSVAGAVAVVVVVVALVLAWRSGKFHGRETAHRPSISAPAVSAPGLESAGSGVGPEAGKNDDHPPAPGPAPKHFVHGAHATAVASANPKLDQFPSPQPLSEQERLLENYVAKYPERAVLLARARFEALQRDQLEEMNAFPSRDRTTDLKERDNDTAER